MDPGLRSTSGIARVGGICCRWVGKEANLIGNINGQDGCGEHQTLSL